MSYRKQDYDKPVSPSALLEPSEIDVSEAVQIGTEVQRRKRGRKNFRILRVSPVSPSKPVVKPVMVEEKLAYHVLGLHDRFYGDARLIRSKNEEVRAYHSYDKAGQVLTCEHGRMIRSRVARHLWFYCPKLALWRKLKNGKVVPDLPAMWLRTLEEFEEFSREPEAYKSGRVKPSKHKGVVFGA